MDSTTRAKLALNAANAWKMASNWVMTAAGAAFALYLALPVEQQQAILQHLPVPPWLVPIATSAVGIVARLWPQRSVSAEVAAAKSATPSET